MREKLELLRKNSLLELQTWAGLSPTPGVNGVIVTNGKKIVINNYPEINSEINKIIGGK